MAVASAVRSSVSPAPAPAPQRTLQRRCACGAKASAGAHCAACDDKRKLFRSPSPWDTSKANDAGLQDPLPRHVDNVLAAPGQALDGAARRIFETRFGCSFGDVRVHADNRAAASARALNADAYASGRDIVFGAGRYDPGSTRGRRLLAHELTHVAQQRAGLSASAAGPVSDNAAEREAERNAERFVSGGAMTATARAPAIARQPAATASAAPPQDECSNDQQRRLDGGRRLALQWLARTIRRLNTYIAAPAQHAQGAVHAALMAHFHSDAPPVVARLHQVLDAAYTDLDARDADGDSFECHTEDDRSCINNNAFARGDLIVLCPPFFSDASQRRRARTLIHETIHALPDGPDAPQIPDRAYEEDRVLPLLSPAEALNNATSYDMFTREVATDREVRATPVKDKIDRGCDDATRALIETSMARAQRWNNRAMTVANGTSRDDFFTTHLGDALPATRSAAARLYTAMVTRLQSPVEVLCDDKAGGACGPGHRAYKGSARDIGRKAGIGAGIGAAIGFIGGLGAGLGAIAGGASALAGVGLIGLGVLAGAALGALGGLIAGALTPRTVLRVCPDWASLPTMQSRTESLLAGLYETYAGVEPTQARRYAALAQALHDDYPGLPPPI